MNLGIQLVNELDLTDNNNLLPVKQINIGFVAEDILRKLLMSDIITTLHVKNFRIGAQKFIIKILSKLFQQSPLGSAVVRHSSIFNPSVMVGLPKKSAQKQLTILLKQLIALNILTPQRCDKIMCQFTSFLDDDCKKLNEKFVEFDRNEHRLDDFYFKDVCVQKYDDLSYVIRIILTLRHGQASVERGFSQNVTVLETNMTPDTIIAKRIVRDHMISKNLKLHTISIDKPLIAAVKAASQKYSIYLEEKKNEKINSENENRILHLIADIEKLTTQCEQIKKAVKLMDDEFVKCIDRAEKKNMSLVIKGNGLKRKSEAKQEELMVLEKQLDDLKVKKQKLGN